LKYNNIISESAHKLVTSFRDIWLEDDTDIILHANSHDATTARFIPDNIDFLFIDGGHSYYDVKYDYELYNSKVRAGGIIAFHDSSSPKYGINHFLNELSFHNKIHYIHHSVETGIAYLIK